MKISLDKISFLSNKSKQEIKDRRNELESRSKYLVDQEAIERFFGEIPRKSYK